MDTTRSPSGATSPERSAQIRHIFEVAMEMPSASRQSYIENVCDCDTEFKRAVEGMVEAAACSECLVERPAVEMKTEPSPVTSRALHYQSSQIGRYRTTGILGEGGMGVVYEAEQDQPRRTVALKLIRPGLVDPEFLRRFEREAQVLGRLQHPGIAQIYEAGTADSGFGPQPYFAMEFIRGNSLLEYAELHQLNARQRLEIMAKVCEAVQHAHQRGIIHRDLKPGNILVDESGQPKVLDFGVARATESDAQATRQTDVGQIVGTLAYMSPEQVLGDPLELDTRCDVYALGVILFELLTGRLPYTISPHVHEAVVTIREKDPARLSSFSRTYRGDIETIVGKALEKDKARRYGSAAGLGADIQRYLRDEPIAARPPSATYQVRKFARRHKALVAGAAAVLIVLIAGSVASTWEAMRARRAEQAATTEAATAKAVNDFLQNDLLAEASASRQAQGDIALDPNLKVRTALDRAAAHIKGKFEKQPLTEASIRQTVGNTYLDLGLYADAQAQLERALDLRRRMLGEQDPDTLNVMQELAKTLRFEGHLTAAEKLHREALDIRCRVLGLEHRDTMISMNNLANTLDEEGRGAEAEKLYREALEIRRRVLGPHDPDTAQSLSNLAGALGRYQGDYAQAEKLGREALDIRRRALGPEHPDTLNSMRSLADALEDEGRHGDAERLYRETLVIQRRTIGPEHPEGSGR